MSHCLNISNHEVQQQIKKIAGELKQKESLTLLQVEVWQEATGKLDEFPTSKELKDFNNRPEEKEPDLLFEEPEDIIPEGGFSPEEDEKERIRRIKMDSYRHTEARDWKELAIRRHKADFGKRKLDLERAHKILEERADMLSADEWKHQPGVVSEAERTIRHINATEKLWQKEFETYKKQYQKAIEYASDIKNAEKSMKELVADYNDFINKFKGDEAKPAKEFILNAINIKAREESAAIIEKNNPGMHVDTESKKDLPGFAKFLYNMASIGESHLDLQALTRELDKTVSERNEEHVAWKHKLKTAIQNLEKEYISNLKGTEKLKRKLQLLVNPLFDRTVLFKFMYYIKDSKNGPFEAKITSEPYANDKKAIERYNALSKPQKEFLKLHDQFTKEFADIQNRENEFGQIVGLNTNNLIKVTKSLADTMASNPQNGLLQNYLKYLSQTGGQKDVIQMYFEGDKENTHSFAEIKDMIATGATKGLWSKVHAIYLLAKYKRKATELLAKRQHEDTRIPWDEKLRDSQYGLTERGRMVSQFQNSGAKYMKDFSGDFGRALGMYMDDMIYIKHMEKLVPLVDSIEYFNKEHMDYRKNTQAFFDIWKRGYLYKSKTLSAEPKYDKYIKFLRAWTHLRVMAFNVPAAVFNVIMGKYQTYRGLETQIRRLGEKRYWLGGISNFKKTQAILDKYHLLSIETNQDYNKSIGHYFDKIMFGLTELGENFIQGSSIIGHLSDKQWKWMNKDGSLKQVDENNKQLTLEQIKEREESIRETLRHGKEETKRLQGAYSKDDIRNFGHFELGRAFSQFRVWMPEAYDDRFGKEKIDAYGNKRQGTLNYMWKEGWKEIGKDIKDPKFFTSDELKYKLKRRNLRSAMAVGVLGTAALIGASAGGGGRRPDDEEAWLTSQFQKALGEMLFIFDPHTLKFTMTNTVAAEGTVASFMDVLLNIGSFYKSGKNKGDWEAPTYIGRTVPYSQVIKNTNNLLDDSN